jgi:hypothetical protein
VHRLALRYSSPATVKNGVALHAECFCTSTVVLSIHVSCAASCLVSHTRTSAATAAMSDVHHCIFCLRADGTPYTAPDIAGQAVTWLTEMFPTEPPVPDVWVQVPRRLRPAGVAHAFFNAYAFLEALEPNFREQSPVRGRAQPLRPFSGRGRRLG